MIRTMTFVFLFKGGTRRHQLCFPYKIAIHLQNNSKIWLISARSAARLCSVDMAVGLIVCLFLKFCAKFYVWYKLTALQPSVKFTKLRKILYQPSVKYCNTNRHIQQWESNVFGHQTFDPIMNDFLTFATDSIKLALLI